jgi:acyl carrier protein
MKGSLDSAFKHELKTLIIKESDKAIDPATIADDAALFGAGSPVQLDSIDGLQISMALQMTYGVRIEDPKQARRVMVNINSLADFLRPE